MKKRLLIAAVVAIAMLGALVIWFTSRRSGPPGTVTMLKDRGALRNRAGEGFASMPTALREPLRKLKYMLVGRPASVVIDVAFIRFTNSESILPGLGTPIAKGMNGFEFILVPQKLDRFRETVRSWTNAEIYSAPKVVVYNGHGANVSQNASHELFAVDLLPRVHNNMTDLVLAIEGVDLIQQLTNTWVAARVNVPRDSGILIAPRSSGVSTGFFVIPNVFHPPKPRK